MINFSSDNNQGYSYTDEEQLVRDASANRLSKFMKWNNPKIEQVGIETINRCNGTCGFCPANCNVDTRKKLIMPENTFDKILSDLKSFNYKEKFCLSVNNEPLLDTSFLDRIIKLKQCFPDNITALYTNGTLLTEKILIELTKYIDEIIIDQYSFDGTQKINSNVKRILVDNFDKLEESSCSIFVNIQNPNLVKLNRGGYAPNMKKSDVRYTHPCARVFWEFNVISNGDVIACCHDVYSNIVIGNVMEESIEEIWNGERYGNLRKMMLSGKRSEMSLCGVCDQISIRTPNNAADLAKAFVELVQKEAKIVIPKESDSSLDIIKHFLNAHSIEYTSDVESENDMVLCKDSKTAIEYNKNNVMVCDELIQSLIKNPNREKDIVIKNRVKKLLSSVTNKRNMKEKFEFLLSH